MDIIYFDTNGEIITREELNMILNITYGKYANKLN